MLGGIFAAILGVMIYSATTGMKGAAEMNARFGTSAPEVNWVGQILGVLLVVGGILWSLRAWAKDKAERGE